MVRLIVFFMLIGFSASAQFKEKARPDSLSLTPFQEQQILSINAEIAKKEQEYGDLIKNREKYLALILDFHGITLNKGEALELKPGKLLIVKPK